MLYEIRTKNKHINRVWSKFGTCVRHRNINNYVSTYSDILNVKSDSLMLQKKYIGSNLKKHKSWLQD